MSETNAQMIKDAREQAEHLKEQGGDFDEWEQLADLAGPLADALEVAERERYAALVAIERVRVWVSGEPFEVAEARVAHPSALPDEDEAAAFMQGYGTATDHVYALLAEEAK